MTENNIHSLVTENAIWQISIYPVRIRPEEEGGEWKDHPSKKWVELFRKYGQYDGETIKCRLAELPDVVDKLAELVKKEKK